MYFLNTEEQDVNNAGIVKACLHIPTPSPSPSSFITVPMVTGRMGSRPILPVRQPVTIDIMLNFDGDGHCDGDGVGMC